MVGFEPKGVFIGSVNAAITQGGLPIIVSLVAVALTESRMARSRGRFSLVRVFAPAGTIGFLGVLKVHIASIVTFKVAQELNLPVKYYASASRIGSMRCMNAGGIEWDKGVNCIEVSMDDETPVKINDAFRFEDESQVNYISTRRQVEVIRRKNVLRNNYERMTNAAFNVLGQAIVCFGSTIGAEYAARRPQPTLGLFFCASVILTEIATAIVEWMWTSTSANLIDIRDAENYMVGSQKIFEQKLRVGITRSELRKYAVNRLVQLRLQNFLPYAGDEWLVTRAEKMLLPQAIQFRGVKLDEEEEEQSAADRKAFSKVKCYAILSTYYVSLLVGALGVMAEIFTYAFYVTASFSGSPNIGNDSNTLDAAIRSFGRWFAVQIGIFVIKATTPFWDRVLHFNRLTDPKRGGDHNYGLYLGDPVQTTTLAALNGKVRAANNIGVLLQTMEHLTSMPPSWSSLVCLSNEGARSCVVPQVLLLSGRSLIERLGIITQAQTEPDEDRIRKAFDSERQAPPLDIFARPPPLRYENFKTDLEEALSLAGDETKATYDKLKKDYIRSDDLIILRFVPHANHSANKAFYAEVAAVHRREIKSEHYWRIITKKTGEHHYSSDLAVWNAKNTYTNYVPVDEVQVLNFSIASVNGDENYTLLGESRILSSNEVPLPSDYATFVQNNPISTDTSQPGNRNHFKDQFSVFDQAIYKSYQLRQQQLASQSSATNRGIPRAEGAQQLNSGNGSPVSSSDIRPPYEQLPQTPIGSARRWHLPPGNNVNESAQNQAEREREADGLFFSKLRNDTAYAKSIGVSYIGRVFLLDCYVHRYYSVISSQGRLMEASKQVLGPKYRSAVPGKPDFPGKRNRL